MIGVTNAFRLLGGGPDRLKRDAIFFEKLALVAGTGAIEAWRNGPYSYKAKYQSWANDVEYLLSSDHFLTLDHYRRLEPGEINASHESYVKMCEQSDQIWREMNDLGSPQGSDDRTRSLTPQESAR